ncbi:MAG TPA: hypothetical protein PLX23_01775 [Candidatus Hydrogenedens sp.]|nr:hypothetical protein [Candidatus Hydrogenedens sp.]
MFEYLYGIELSFRKSFGIRPTPLRWRIWAGKPLVISWNDSGNYLISFKPSILFRLFIAPKRKNREFNLADGNLSGGKLYYRWQNNELLISNSETLLSHFIPFSTKPLNVSKNVNYIEFGRKNKLTMFINAEKDNHIEGEITINGSKKHTLTPPLDLIGTNHSFALSYTPFIELLSDESMQKTFQALFPKNMMQPLHIWLDTFKNTSVEKIYLKMKDERLLKDSVLIYLGTSKKYSNPIPLVGIWFPYEDSDLKSLLSKHNLELPYYSCHWASYEGYLIPIWNDAICLSMVYYKDGWLICSQESLMAELLASLSQTNSQDTPNMSIHFTQLSEDIEKLLLWCARLELLNGTNERDINNLFSPWKQLMKEMGTFYLYTHYSEDKEEMTFSFNGDLINEP